MSHLSPTELAKLNEVARELRETWGARGYKVGTALSLDSDFTENNEARSTLTRAMIRRAYVRGASNAEVWCEKGPGGAKELHISNGSTEFIFRLLKATAVLGTYLIHAKDDSMLRNLEVTLFGHQERWVFGYTLADDDLADIFVAPVIDVVGGSPGHLVLGPAILLDSGTPPSGTGEFLTNEEDLELGDAQDDEFGEGWVDGSGDGA